MFEWIYNFIADVAYDSAIKSVDVASCNGMFQMEMPEALKKISTK